MDSLKYFQASTNIFGKLSNKFTEELYRCYLTEEESFTIYLDT